MGGITVGIGCFELDVWGNRFILQGQNSFDQASKSRTAFRVSDVGFHRADIQFPFTKDVSHRFRFDTIARGGARSVALLRANVKLPLLWWSG